MARGCPVVASNATALPEVVRAAGLLVPPGDVARWSAALLEVVGSSELRADLSARGLRRSADFTWPACAEAHLDAYDAASERGPHS